METYYIVEPINFNNPCLTKPVKVTKVREYKNAVTYKYDDGVLFTLIPIEGMENYYFFNEVTVCYYFFKTFRDARIWLREQIEERIRSINSSIEYGKHQINLLTRLSVNI